MSQQGRMVWVDLGERKVDTEAVPASWRDLVLGGNGLAALALLVRQKAGVDPLAPESLLVFAPGAACGLPIMGACVAAAMARSPLTGFYYDSYMAGHFGVELMNAGCALLGLKGKSAEPSYLFVHDGVVEIRKADHLWGLGTFATQQAIRHELGDEKVQVAAIGPAGEKLVRFACLVSATRAWGRGGLGAVMGAKNLKAIAVRGTLGVRHPDPQRVLAYARKLRREMMENKAISSSIRTFGSAASVATINRLGILGARNWQQEFYPGADAITGEGMLQAGMRVKGKACAACLAASGIVWQGVEGPYRGIRSRGPEYETLYAFGSLCGNNCASSIVAADRLADDLGLDTISAGATLALVMECVERGLLTEKEVGVDLRFGRHESMLEALKLIAFRQGFGDLMAEGVKRLAQRLGSGAEKLAVHVKGLEMPGHSARGLKGMALGYAVSPRGGSHQDTRPGPERSGKFDRASWQGKAAMVRASQNMTAVGDSLGICRRHWEPYAGDFLNERYAELATVVTGREYSVGDLEKVGDRVHTIERLLYVREGGDSRTDRLPGRFLEEPIPDGPSAGMVVEEQELEEAKQEFYRLRGWDPSGVPRPECLEFLGLSGIVE